MRFLKRKICIALLGLSLVISACGSNDTGTHQSDNNENKSTDVDGGGT